MSTHSLGVGLTVLLLMSFQQFLEKHQEKLGNALFLHVPAPAFHPPLGTEGSGQTQEKV